MKSIFAVRIKQIAQLKLERKKNTREMLLNSRQWTQEQSLPMGDRNRMKFKFPQRIVSQYLRTENIHDKRCSIR